MVATGTNRKVNRAILYTVVIILSLLFLFPGLWTFLNSLRSIYSINQLIPSSIHWGNYAMAFTLVPYLQYIGNSFIISGITVVLTTISSGIVGFGFARLEAPGKKFLFMFILSTMMLPTVVTQIPTYVVFNRIGLTNNFWPWVFWGIGGSPFFIFLYRQFFMNIPKDLDESARIDGCTSFGIFWRIFIPLSIPIITTVVVMSFQGSWGDFMTPFMFLDSDKWNLATALIGANYTLPNNPNIQLIPVINAATLLFALPIIITFFIGQRYLIEGIVTSGLKA
ncbi:carbohydrate ABC transporter permease [Alicyclobacillus fodiniaquatilis]|uniref:Carbohydrate ABC transporter permease n=1 Tax=Alicyclobacillus fodiniaquatilis TaxID=1661150 RepID=A0ABW4JQG9_9BACL